MNITKKVLRTIKEHELIPEHSDIVLGLSGGPDSMALFYALMDYMEKRDWIIHPVHINHKFRPGAAEEDQKYVEDLCFSLYESTSGRVRPCASFVVDCNMIAELNDMTSEEAGRAVRYESFINVASKLKSAGRTTVIAVAQNADDQAETILFRILRGTSVDGLSGIAYKRFEESVPVVRPLLDCSRGEIEEYLKDRGIEPRRDKTNEEPLYTRNKIRLELLPKLKEYNPAIVKALNRLGEAAACDKEYLNDEARRHFEDCLIEVRGKKASESDIEGSIENHEGAAPEKDGVEVVLDNRKTKALHRAVRYRVYNIAVSQAGMRENMTNVYLEAIDKVSDSLNGKAYTELNGGYRVRRETNKLVFYRI